VIIGQVWSSSGLSAPAYLPHLIDIFISFDSTMPCDPFNHNLATPCPFKTSLGDLRRCGCDDDGFSDMVGRITAWLSLAKMVVRLRFFMRHIAKDSAIRVVVILKSILD
jgi:hypothetical protein